METDPPAPADDAPDRAAERHDLGRVLDDEVAGLSDAHRAVLAMCVLDGITNAEAATRLGVPVGTVDSRLHAAKAKLRQRLIGRGIAGAASLSLAVPLAGPAGEELLHRTVTAAAGFALGQAIAPPLVVALATEVSNAMTLLKFKLLAGAAMALTLAGGTGVYLAQAPAAKPSDPPAKAKAEPAKPAEPKAAATLTATTTPGTTQRTTAVLAKPAGFEKPFNLSLGELLNKLTEETGVTFRAEENWLTHNGVVNPYDQEIAIRVVKGLSVSDILNETCDYLNYRNSSSEGVGKVGYRVKGNQVIIGPKFIPASAPSNFTPGIEGQPLLLPQSEIVKVLYGPTVSLSVTDKTLHEIVDLLREQTGANIVINERARADTGFSKEETVTLTLNDTKLFTVLKIVGDLFGLAPASVDNVFYLTSPDKATEMNRETSRALFGEPAGQQPVMVPIDKDGKFVPHRWMEMFGGMGGGDVRVLPNFVPHNVDEAKAKKP
jgi:hypothetical protein